MNRIKSLRLEKGWRQTDLAQHLNTKQQTVARYETGDREPDIATIGKLCGIFGVTADYLLGFSPLRGMELSPEEESLLLAHRRADARTRELVRLALEPFWQAESSGTETTSA